MPAFADHSRIEDGWVSMQDGSTLDDLLRHLRVPFRFAAVLLCMVNYEKVPLTTILHEGDTVSFLSLMAGG